MSATTFSTASINMPGFAVNGSGIIATGLTGFSSGGIQFQGITSGLVNVNVDATATGLAFSKQIFIGGSGVNGTLNLNGSTSGFAQLSVSSTGGTLFLGAGNVTIDGSGNLSTAGFGTIANATAIPAGGTAGAGYKFSSTSNFGVFFGSGVPTLSAAKGSLYLRSDGSSASTRAYINSDGAASWVAITTAS